MEDPNSENPYQSSEDMSSQFELGYQEDKKSIFQKIFGMFGGGGGSSNNTKIIIAVLVLGAGGYWFYDGGSLSFITDMIPGMSSEPTPTPTPAPIKPASHTEKPQTPPAHAAVEHTTVDHSQPPALNPSPVPVAKEMGAPAVTSTTLNEAPTLISPDDGAYREYDESSAPAEFKWMGSSPATIAYSKNTTMEPIFLQEEIKGTSTHLPRLLPGTWYWHVTNKLGSSEVRKFDILPPKKRAVVLKAPTSGSDLSGNGGTVSWVGDTRIAHFRVELSDDPSFSQIKYRFATTATQVNLKDVPAGKYHLRVGAFSEVSGRWEFTEPVDVSVK